MSHRLPTRFRLLLTLAAGSLLLLASPLVAQGPGPITPRRPSVSPYLNLLRGGNAAVNYYGIVRPQNEFRAAGNVFANNTQRMQSQLNQQSRALEQSEISQLRPTGHTASFNTHARYFFTNGPRRR